MKLHPYVTTGGKNLILDYIDDLNNDEMIDGYSVLMKLAQKKFNELTIKKWRGKISEVYFYKHNRIFYVAIDNEDMYLIHACRKQKNKTETKDSQIIIKRTKELEEKLSLKLI